MTFVFVTKEFLWNDLMNHESYSNDARNLPSKYDSCDTLRNGER